MIHEEFDGHAVGDPISQSRRQAEQDPASEIPRIRIAAVFGLIQFVGRVKRASEMARRDKIPSELIVPGQASVDLVDFIIRRRDLRPKVRPGRTDKRKKFRASKLVLKVEFNAAAVARRKVPGAMAKHSDLGFRFGQKLAGSRRSRQRDRNRSHDACEKDCARMGFSMQSQREFPRVSIYYRWRELLLNNLAADGFRRADAVPGLSGCARGC
jgi:hypothetical protein